MKKLLIGLLMIGTSTVVYAEWYKVVVTRVSRNLYKTKQGLYIETKFCHEFARRDEAILKYNKYDKYNNKLIFSNGSSCDVKKLIG